MAQLNQDTRWSIQLDHLSLATLKSILKAKNYSTTAGCKKPYLRQCVERVEKGLMQYKRYTTKDLHQFLQDRNVLPGSDDWNISRAEVIKLLEVADNNLHFVRFMDLPTEIRSMVYDYAINTNTIAGIDRPDKPLLMPDLPALSQVSRLVRMECLDLFYKTARFPLFIWPFRRRSHDYPSRYMILGPGSHVFLRCTEDRNVRSIRHFELFIGTFDHSLASPHTIMVVQIFLKTKSVVVLSHNPAALGSGSRDLGGWHLNEKSIAVAIGQRNESLMGYLETLATKAGSFTGHQIYTFCKDIQLGVLHDSNLMFHYLSLRLLIDIV